MDRCDAKLDTCPACMAQPGTAVRSGMSSGANYVDKHRAPWPQIRAELDTVWSIDIDDAQREAWLLARHMRHGRSEDAAREWIAQTDAPNAARIAARAHQADRHLTWDGARLCFA